MPLFTSNSSPALVCPPGRWSQVWFWTLVLSLAGAMALEISLRAVGHHPSVVDDFSLWSYWREKASGSSLNTVVVLGSSRIQLGFSPAAWRQEFPEHQVIQLAINGTQPLATLTDLARDNRFRGTVILDAPASLIGWSFDDQQAYVDYFYRQWNLQQRWERFLRTFLQRHFVFVNPSADIRRLKGALFAGKLPPPFYIETFPDRSRQADYQAQPAILPGSPSAPKSGPVRLDDDQRKKLAVMRQGINAIRQRGGRVILVRLPSSGQTRLDEDCLFPKALFWAPFTRADGAFAINFEEVPALAGFTCQDGGHLDKRDAPSFTLRLAQEIKKRQLLL